MKFLNTSSLKVKIGFLITILLGGFVIILFFATFFQYYMVIKNEIIDKSIFKVKALSSSSVSDFFLGDIQGLERLSKPYLVEYTNWIVFLKPSGEVLSEFGKSKFPQENNDVIKWAVSVDKPSSTSFILNKERNFVFSSPILEEKEKGVYETIGFVMMCVSNKIIYSKLLSIAIITLIFCLIFGSVFIVTMVSIFNKEIITPIISISDTLYKVSEEKDLVLEIKIEKKDEVGLLSKSFNNLLSSFKNIILAITKTTGVVGDATSNIFQSIQQQTQNVQQVTTTVSQVSNSMSNISQAAQNISNLLIQVNNITTQGKQNVADTSTKIENIYSALSVALTQSQELGKKSQSIGEIVGMITKIADQTNLLSLNAAIEAARAGEAGRGFAVVADEIRKLAETSSQQAQKISQILNEIVSGIDVSVKSTQELLNQATEAVRLINQSSKMFLDIAEMINKSSTNMEQVASLVEETSAAAQEVAASIEEQSAATEEISAQSSKLAEIVEELKKQIQQFKV